MTCCVRPVRRNAAKYKAIDDAPGTLVVHGAYERSTSRFLPGVGGAVPLPALISRPPWHVNESTERMLGMDEVVTHTKALRGTVSLPADKSIAHRAALISALADGPSEIIGYPDSDDPQSTLASIEQLGIHVERQERSTIVQGVGLEGLRAPDRPIDCGNSGTTMRLLAGILAGQDFDATLTGDFSLSKRPMSRIADPLSLMGARITLTEGHAPIRVEGRHPLQAIRYVLPMASAQVKSCVLLAGLFAEGQTVVVESNASRDHTERMLQLDVFQDAYGREIAIDGGRRIAARTWRVPADFSAAAFFLVAGTIVPNSELQLPDVGLNPTRTGLLDVLQAMGAQIEVRNERDFGGETIGDLTVRTSSLHGLDVGGDVIPRLIDEIPVLAVAAACAEGRTRIFDAEELRFKETDRISALVRNLRKLGARIEEKHDGMEIEGPAVFRGAFVDSEDDHRIAMAMAVAGLAATGNTTISRAECAAVSFPGFWDRIRKTAAAGA